jgi:hypothetical protein
MVDRISRKKLDAFEELGITNNPKREKLYSKAWEFGHPSGLQEVSGQPNLCFGRLSEEPNSGREILCLQTSKEYDDERI